MAHFVADLSAQELLLILLIIRTAVKLKR